MAQATIHLETPYSGRRLSPLASKIQNRSDGRQAAAISSGLIRGVDRHDLVVPCSMETLAAIRCGYGGSLIARAADS